MHFYNNTNVNIFLEQEFGIGPIIPVDSNKIYKKIIVFLKKLLIIVS